ncbi:MAG: CDP-archaeol synthase [Phycisphaerales bacterium]|nr:MAG: CDP-archaeol synthase [Phycisphaerales bacterium]
MVTTRILFGTLMTLIAFGVIALDAHFAHGWHSVQDSPIWQRLLNRGGLSALLVLVLTVAAVIEFNRLLERGGLHPLRAWTATLSAALVLTPWLTAVFSERAAALLDLRITMVILVAGLVGSAIVLIARRQPANGLLGLGTAMLAVIYVGLLMSFAVRLRVSHPGPPGAWVALLWAAVVKFTDVGAFFTGLTIGRTPLIPSISPNKTVQGFLGGIITGVIIGLLIYLVLPPVRPCFALTRPPHIYLLVFAIVMSVAGQLGDLVESLFKRSVQAKDSGAVIPEFGGILDVIDALLLTAPIAWLMLSPWPTGA